MTALTRKPHRPRAWLLPLIAACLFLPDLGGHVARREQEMRVLLTARDMVETGRWLEPHFKNEPRLRKPPLMYWLVGGLYRLGAPVTDPGWGRLPSALAGIGFVSMLYALGRRFVGRRRAFAAALVASVSVIILRQSKLAETDMCLSLFTATSALAGALALRGASRSWWLLSLVAAGLGFMIKGPAAVTLPPVAWIAYAWWRRWRVASPFRAPAFWIGIALCVAIAAPWYILINLRANATTDAQLHAEMTALLTSSKHTGPFYYYVYTALHAMAPWSLLLPGALVYGFRLGRNRSGWGFPLVWFATSVVILSCLSSKQIHYATLLVAPASLAMGCALYARGGWIRTWSRWTGRIIAGLLLACSAVLLGGLLLRLHPAPLVPAALCLAAAGLVASALRQARPPAACAPVFALALAALLPAALRLTTADGSHGTATRAVTECAMRGTPREAPVVCLGPLNTTAAFYADRPVDFAATLEEAWSNAAPGTVILATFRADDAPAPERMPVKPAWAKKDRATYAAALVKPPAR